MKQLHLALFDGPASRAPGDTLLVLIPEDERPLRGGAGLLDWRVGGEISRLLLSGFVTGERGEAALLSAGRMLTAERMLLYGVGKADDLPGDGLQQALRAAIRKLLALKQNSVALALPGAFAPSSLAEELLRGLCLGVAEAEDHPQLFACLPEARECERAIGQALDDAVAYARARGVAISVDWLDAPAEAAAG